VLSGKKPLIILSFAAPNLYEKSSVDYEKLINSIKKITQEQRISRGLGRR